MDCLKREGYEVDEDAGAVDDDWICPACELASADEEEDATFRG